MNVVELVDVFVDEHDFIAFFEDKTAKASSDAASYACYEEVFRCYSIRINCM